MSKLEEETKEVEQSNCWKQNNLGKQNSPRAQEKMAVGIEASSGVMCNTRSLPPEKNIYNMMGTNVGSNNVKTSKNSSDFHNTNCTEADEHKIYSQPTIASNLRGTSSPPSSPDSWQLNTSPQKVPSTLSLNSIQSKSDTVKKTAKKPRRQAPKREGQQAGRWTAEEHELFLEGLKLHGREWKKVAEKITTRTSAQIRSHAQKYFSKLSKESAELNSLDGYAMERDHLIGNSSMEALGNVAFDASTQNFGEQLPPSIMEKVTRIMKDPTKVENEVEAKLTSLRERYLQLQVRLQKQEELKRKILNQNCQYIPNNSSGGPRVITSVPSSIAMTEKVINNTPTYNSAPANLCTEMKFQLHEKNLCSVGPATAALEARQRKEATEGNFNEEHQTNHAELPSVTTHSLISASSNREFGSEELIALQVLGGSLGELGTKARYNTTSIPNENISRDQAEQSSKIKLNHKRKFSNLSKSNKP